LLESFIEKIAPQLPNIAEFMLLRTDDTNNEETALEASEFWLAFAESPQICKEVLAPILGKLLPVLIKCMRYSETDIILLKVFLIIFYLKFSFGGDFLGYFWKFFCFFPKLNIK